MKRMGLSGNYKLKRLDFGTDISFVFQDDFYPAGYLDIQVPGDVRTALRQYGLIDGYYLGKNLDGERWIDESDWLFVKDFYCEEELQEKENTLCLEGVDTLAEIWLNGTCVGKTRNMFRIYRFDVGGLLNYGGNNTLAIKILSPVKSTEGIDRTGIYPEDDTTRMLLRKSQMNWGWDFCGHCLTTGIWKGIYLDGRSHAVLKKVHFRTVRIEDGRAILEADVSAQTYKNENGRLEAEILFFWKNELVARKNADLGKMEIVIPEPHLWWPRPYGEAALYEVAVILYENGCKVDERMLNFGIRTVVLHQEKMERGGRQFLLEINGRPLFVRGANWVPLNCVYSEIRKEDYDFYIKRICESNLSMLRVWGGGIYEPDYFFDLCDKNGIMIFQDFMLACGIFPQNDEFLKEVEEEAAEVIDWYYNRPSLVMWSADNELDQAYWWYDLQEHFRENRVNRVGIQNAVKKEDPYRPFLVSSPCSPYEEEEGGDDPNSPLQGDMHVYLTRFDRESEYYYKKLLEFEPRFMSEYGFSSLPVEESYYVFNFFGEKLDLSRNPWLGELSWMAEVGEKGTEEEIIYLTQYTHAQALKYWIEYLRSLKGVCGGSLYWKFNDPIAPNRENMLFPTMMSAIDFMRRPKLAYYYAKRAYEDVILAFREEAEGLGVYGCNETLRGYSGELTVSAFSWGGEVLWQKGAKAEIEADAATRLMLIDRKTVDQLEPEKAFIYVELEMDGRKLENRFMPLQIGDFNRVQMPEAELKISVSEAGDNRVLVIMETDSYVQDVMLSVQDEDVFFSDNAFCLNAGSRKNCCLYFEKGNIHGKRLQIKAWNAKPQVIML